MSHEIQPRESPRTFADIIGQSEAVTRLKGLRDLAANSGESAPHFLLVGPTGSGRRTLAQVFANELGVTLVSTGVATIQRGGDLIGLMSNLAARAVLLIEDVDRLSRHVEELLPAALQDLSVNFVMETGLHARTITHRLPPFTCIGAVAKLSDLSPKVRVLFPIAITLQPYPEADVALIAIAQARAQGLALTPGAAALVSRLANGNLRQCASLIQLLRIGASGEVTEQQVADRLSQLGFPIAAQKTDFAPGRDPASLSGVEFEHYIGELLTRMGFRTEVTRQSGDGGVDVVATLDRPIVGGRYLIQCKRFAPDTLIGAPTVREFYGALIADRRAVKGVLITTSDFTAQAREFAATLPIELIAGTELRALVAAHDTESSQNG